MQSKAATVQDYLAELPPDRRAAISAIRDVIRRNLDKNYEERMSCGMIGYIVPHKVYPAGYHCDPSQPVPFACLASQKNHMAVYLMSVYGDSDSEKWFREQWARTGKKLDMGKCCVRFRKLEDAALDVIGAAIRRCPARKFLARYEKAMKMSAERRKPATAAKRTVPVSRNTASKASAAKSRTQGRSTRTRKTSPSVK